MRIIPQPLLGGRDLDLLEDRDSHLSRLLPRHLAVCGDRFRDLVPDGEDGVERGQRLLEHHRDCVSSQGSHIALWHRPDVFARKQHLAACDASRRIRKQPHHGQCRHGFAASRFADQRQCLAFAELKGDAAHHVHVTLTQKKRGREVSDVEGNPGGAHPWPLSRGSRTSRRPSPSTFRPSTRSTMTTPGIVLSQWLRSM